MYMDDILNNQSRPGGESGRGSRRGDRNYRKGDEGGSGERRQGRGTRGEHADRRDRFSRPESKNRTADTVQKNRTDDDGAETQQETQVRVVGVRFRTAGKIYYFDPAQFELKRNDHVIVETVRGIEYGSVVGKPMMVSEHKINLPLRQIIRIATPDDDEREERNREKGRDAFYICKEKIKKHGLQMKLIDAEYTFDNSKILFYFTSDGRVDFRDLVKDLAGVFRTRIELRQIGVRDETKILGGYGICGRPLCCHTYLTDFVPVSIRMAKEQNLSLNPGKISGVCGRLMCCLKNEEETYEELNRGMPRPGDEIEASDGLRGTVDSTNVLQQTVRMLVEVNDEKEIHEYNVKDITITRRRRRSRQNANSRKKKENRDNSNKGGKDSQNSGEMKELEKMENEDRKGGKSKLDE